MAAQWNIQQAMTELQDEMGRRFDRIEDTSRTAAIEQARLEGRVSKLEEKAGWIGAGIGASLVGILGLLVAFAKTKLGM